MEIKKTVLEDTTTLKEIIEQSLEPEDERLREFADVSISINFKNVTKVGRVQILAKEKSCDINFYVIFTKNDENSFYIWDIDLYTFEEYANMIATVEDEEIADMLLDIIYSKEFLLEE